MDLQDRRKWHPLEHRVHKTLKSCRLPAGAKLWVAFSGGEDSSVLAVLMHRLQRAHSWESLRLLHFHHGHSLLRDQMRNFCEAIAKHKSWKLDHVEYQGSFKLKSEAELRAFRKTWMDLLLESSSQNFLATGHHEQDVLETQVMRLLRGTGPQGLRQAIRVRRGQVIRPLLELSKNEVRELRQFYSQPYFDDPSNSETTYLRNWLRKKAFPALEGQSPGSLGSLSRSLSLISEQAPQNLLKHRSVTKESSNWDGQPQEKLGRKLVRNLGRYQRNDQNRDQSGENRKDPLEGAVRVKQKKEEISLDWDSIVHSLEIEALREFFQNQGFMGYSKALLENVVEKRRKGKDFSLSWKGACVEYNAGQLTLKKTRP